MKLPRKQKKKFIKSYGRVVYGLRMGLIGFVKAGKIFKL